jgi:hypothetical protein
VDKASSGLKSPRRNRPKFKEKSDMVSVKECLIGLAVVAALALAPPRAVGGDGCRLFAEVSVEAIKAGSMAVCVRTGHPVACAIAAAADDVATSGLAKEGLTAGCEWAVEKVGTAVRIRVKADARKAAEIDRTKKALQTSKDVKWRERAP